MNLSTFMTLSTHSQFVTIVDFFVAVHDFLTCDQCKIRFDMQHITYITYANLKCNFQNLVTCFFKEHSLPGHNICYLSTIFL